MSLPVLICNFKENIRRNTAVQPASWVTSWKTVKQKQAHLNQPRSPGSDVSPLTRWREYSKQTKWRLKVQLNWSSLFVPVKTKIIFMLPILEWIQAKMKLRYNFSLFVFFFVCATANIFRHKILSFWWKRFADEALTDVFEVWTSVRGTSVWSER